MFDSGVGGLSVMREIHRELPHEDLLYAADSGHAPYGEKPPEFIQQRAFAIVSFLIDQGAKAVVVACNTATGIAVDALRARWSIPIVAIEPAIKPAVARTRSGVVGVLATTQTIASARFARLVDSFGGEAEVLSQACPGLVEEIERGEVAGPGARALVADYVAPLLARGADTIVLGCTHYPFVSDVIRSVVGPNVEIIDPAAAVARELRRRLGDQNLLTASTRPGTTRLWTSGPPDVLQAVTARLGFDVVAVQALPV